MTANDQSDQQINNPSHNFASLPTAARAQTRPSPFTNNVVPFFLRSLPGRRLVQPLGKCEVRQTNTSKGRNQPQPFCGAQCTLLLNSMPHTNHSLFFGSKGALASYQQDVFFWEWRECYNSNDCEETCERGIFNKDADETCDEFKDNSCADINACCTGCAAEFKSYFACDHVQWAYNFATEGEYKNIGCPPFVCGDEPAPGPACAEEAIAIRDCFNDITCDSNPSEDHADWCHEYDLCKAREGTCCSQCASEINAYLDCQKPNHCAYCPGDPTPPPTEMPTGSPSAAPSFSLPPSAGPTSAPSGAPTNSGPSEPFPVTVLLFVPRLILGAFLGLPSFFGSLFGLA